MCQPAASAKPDVQGNKDLIHSVDIAGLVLTCHMCQPAASAQPDVQGNKDLFGGRPVWTYHFDSLESQIMTVHDMTAPAVGPPYS